jgi:hypothetical protein
MPVPRVFEAATDPREEWVHVVATLLSLGGPDTRAALMEELTGERLEGTEAMLVREQRHLGDSGVTADISCRATDGAWTVALYASLAFDIDHAAALAALHDAADAASGRTIVVAVTPDRRPGEGLAADGRDIRHRSWQRVRDWVQERPERGGATGADLMLLTEADYFLTPRVADLYRLEESAMPSVAAELRPTLATAYFDLGAIAPSPRVETTASEVAVHYPRTGDSQVSLVARGGALEVRIGGGGPGPGVVMDGEVATLAIAVPEDYATARSWVAGEARAALPPRR